MVCALPGMLVLLMFHYVPLLGNVIAFKDYQPFIGIIDSQWSGLENFKIITDGDPDFVNALLNTLVITFLQLVFVFPVPIALALLMNSLISERLKRLVQSVLYLPHFMSWVVVVAVFQVVLGNSGPLAHMMLQQGAGSPDLVGNPDMFKLLLVLQVIWKDTGWGTILFLAALAGIDPHLYEATAVDGASRVRQLWHVTLPGIKPVIILILILRLGSVLTVGFEQIILQQPAVGRRASEVLDTYVYNNGVLAGEWGTATAVGLVKGVVGLLLVLGANKLAHIFEHRPEHGEVQRHLPDPEAPVGHQVSHHQLVDAVVGHRVASHQVEGVAIPAPWDEGQQGRHRSTQNLPFGSEDRLHHQAVTVARVAQAAQRHREPALGVGVTPRIRQLDQGLHLGWVDVTVTADPGPVAELLQPLHRLPDRPQAPAVQVELTWIEDCLIAQPDHSQPGGRVRRRARLAGADHGRHPTPPMGQVQPGVDGRLPVITRSERVAAGQADPEGCPIGDGALAAAGEHHRLVPPGGEVGQRVVDGLAHQRAHAYLVVL